MCTPPLGLRGAADDVTLYGGLLGHSACSSRWVCFVTGTSRDTWVTVTPSDVARSYLESFSGGHPDAIAAHVAPGFVNEHASALGDGCVGADEYRARLPGFLEAMQGLRYDVDALIADGPRVAVQYRLTATSDGHPVDVRGVMVLDVENQRIAHRTDYWDSLTYLRQTGQA